MNKRTKEKLRQYITSLVVLLLLAAASYLWEWVAPIDSYTVASTDTSLLHVDIIDVGQGSSALLRTQSHTILIDAGELAETEKLKQFLLQNNVHTLDYAIVTHAHTDHFGGMLWVLDNVTVKEFIMPAIDLQMSPTNSAYDQLLTALENNGCTVTLADRQRDFDLGGAQMRLLGPFLAQPKGLNDTSLCFRIDAGEVSFLITGDGETATEDALRKSEDIDVDVLVAGHHGSSTSSRTKFVAAVSPKVSAISLGENNSYGHPNKNVLQTLASFGPVYRTDRHQTVSFLTDGLTITCRTQSGEQHIIDVRE